MKKVLAISLLAFGLTACGGNATTQNTTAPTRANANSAAPQNSADSLVASSHSAPKQAPTAAGNSAPSKSTESPMARPIDVSDMTAEIERAEKAYKQKPSDAKAKEDLAQAYFKRAFALTEAAQYRAALGDFRKGLKLKPDDEKAKNMQGEIIRIFAGMSRQPPAEGEEPPPLPFNKTS
jgi:tetratricopeptide (TPR) repeat protein